jgi:hypothetical protein
MPGDARFERDDRVLAARAARWLRWNSSIWPHLTPALFTLLGLTVLVLAFATPAAGAWLIAKLALLGVLALVVAWDIIPDGTFDMFDSWVGDKLTPQQRSAGWALYAYLHKGDLEPLRLERQQNGAATDRLLAALATHAPRALRERAAEAAAKLGASPVETTP